MSDQPEDANAETTQFAAVQQPPVEAIPPAAVQQPIVETKASNRSVIMAAVGGAIAVAVIALAGVVGFAIGSHHSNHRAGFGPGNLGQVAQDFQRHHNQMMDDFDQQEGGSGLRMEQNQQSRSPGQIPQEMMNQEQTE